jgi:hypothetical protein
MPSAYYTCNLLPLEFVAATGYTPRWLGEHLQDPTAPVRRDALSIHPMTCPYVTRLVAAADVLLDQAPPGDVLLVPGGCDAMRRMGDLLAAEYPERVFVLSMPRSSGESDQQALAAGLARMEDWLRRRAQGGDPDPAASAAAAGAAPAAGTAAAPPADRTPSVAYPSPPRAGGVFLVAGPLSDDSLLRLIGQLGAHVAGLESCTSPDRWGPLSAAGAPAEAGVGTCVAASAPTKAGAEAGPGTCGDPGGDAPSPRRLHVARQMLELGVCPRRSTSERRAHLAHRLDQVGPTSIIYARQSFCDPGAYDALLVAQLAEERGLPYLEIEVGFPFEASGPLRTRVEAFLEAQLLDDDLLDDLLDGGDLFDGDLDGED